MYSSSAIVLPGILHLPSLTLLDVELADVKHEDDLSTLLDRRFGQLDPDTQTTLKDSFLGLFRAWRDLIANNGSTLEALVNPSTLNGGGNASKYLLALHTTSSLLDAHRTDDDLSYPERTFIWKPVSAAAMGANIPERAKKVLHKVPKSVESWKSQLQCLSDIMAHIEPTTLKVATAESIQSLGTPRYTDAFDFLLAFDKSQTELKEARQVLEMIARLALVTSVFLKVRPLFSG